MTYIKPICCAMALFTSLSGFALTATTNGVTWTYTVSGGTATITGSSRKYGAIAIPSNLGGYNVRCIGIEVFRKSDLTSVTIPDSVTHINTNAFRECYSLSSVTLGNGIETIDNAAFKDCSSLTNVTLPSSLTLIHNYVFAGCTSLTEMTVPDKVTYLRPHAFEDCTGLINVKIGKKVSKISDGCFARCSSLTSVTFTGDAPTYFGTGVFTGVASGCRVYVNRGSTGWGVTIPGTWEGLSICYISICYMSCKVRLDANGGTCATASLDVEVDKAIGTLPVPTRINGGSCEFLGWFTSDGVRVTESTIVKADMTLYAHWNEIWLYDYDVDGDIAITCVKEGIVPTGDLVVPAKIDGRTVTAIAEHAFDGYGGLTSVTILGNNTRIDNGAFYGCTGLTNVMIGSVGDAEPATMNNSQLGHHIQLSVRSVIGDYAFYGCSNLKKVSIVGANSGYIGDYAFSGCAGLVEVLIDTSEFDGGRIGDFAFQDCQMLNRLIFEGDTYEPSLGVGTFEGVSSDCRAYIRHASVNGWNAAISYSWGGVLIDYLDHVVTFNANGGTGGKSIVLDTGDTIVAPTVTRAGYSFVGWLPTVAATMPSNDVTYVAQWTSLAYTVKFDANGGTGGTTNIQDCGSPIVAPVVTREGYTFRGWTPSVAATVPPYNVIYTAKWEINKYAVAFDANGGTCEPGAVTVEHGSPIEELPTPFRANAVFLGWFTEVDGGTRVEESLIVTEAITFYAHWLTEVSTPIIKTDGDATLFRADSCAVSISCATDGATIYYTDDGSTPKRYEDYLYTGPVTITETTTFKAVAVAGGIRSAYATVTITKKPLTMEEVLDVGEGVTVATSAILPWRPILDSNAEVGDASAQSGAIGDKTNTWLAATVEGVGTMVFWCKTSCEHDEDGMFMWDRLMVYTNGIEIVEWRMDGETDWTRREVSFAGGENTVKWVYYKDKSGVGGEDCAWVDGVMWTLTDPIPPIVSDSEVLTALAGTTDVNLTANVTNAAQYTAYRAWALSVTNDTTTAQMVKESTRTWLSYAFAADALIDKELTSDDVKIESFTPASTDGKFEFTVSVKDVNIGGGSVAVETLKENLKKVLGIEGSATLSPGGFSSDNIDITFDTPVDGKARFIVSPPADAGNSFFMRVKVK